MSFGGQDNRPLTQYPPQTTVSMYPNTVYPNNLDMVDNFNPPCATRTESITPFSENQALTYLFATNHSLPYQSAENGGARLMTSLQQRSTFSNGYCTSRQEPQEPVIGDGSPHFVIEHTDKRITCACGAQFNGERAKNVRANYKRHLESLTSGKIFVCVHCGKYRANRRDNVQSHIKVKHPNKPEDIIKTFCEGT
jgi:hypothetical protein